MSWVFEHQRNWRIALLVVMVVAFMGPWGFDLINVPSEYECTAPYIRLEGDFCGEPWSIVWAFPRLVGSLISSLVGLMKGELALIDWIRGFGFGLLLFLPFLPIFSTLFLILGGDQQPKQIFTIIVWILAIGMGLFMGLNDQTKLFWKLWGLWLYIGLAVCALILEIIVIRERRAEKRIPTV